MNVLILNDKEGLIWSSPAIESLKDSKSSELSSSPFILHNEGDPDLPLNGLDTSNPTLLSKVVAIIALRERTSFTKQTFQLLPNLKIILQTGGHAYHIDQEAAKSLGIIVALGRRVASPSFAVAELTFYLITAALRTIPDIKQFIYKNKDSAYNHSFKNNLLSNNTSENNNNWPSLMGRSLKDKKLGIIGYGRIGKRIYNLAKAYGMEVVCWDRLNENKETPSSLSNNNNDNKANAQTITSHNNDDVPVRIKLNELLSTCDIVSIHLRLTNETRDLINKNNLKLMKKGSIIINTSRGAIINQEDLIQALQDLNHPLFGAGLDVFEEEPLSASSPLRSLANVVMTPHIGFTVKEVFHEFALIATQQLIQFTKGTLPENELLFPLNPKS